MIDTIQAALGFELKKIYDIEAFMGRQFPASYLAIMSPAKEMVGSMYSKTAFFSPDGKLIGLNLYDSGLEDKQLRFLHTQEFPDLMALNLSKNKLTTFTLAKTLPALRQVVINENAFLKRIRCEEGLTQLNHLEIKQTGIAKFRIPASYTALQSLHLSRNKQLVECRFSGTCPQLEGLFLQDNALKEFELPAEGFEGLIHLYLNQNSLSQLALKGRYPHLLTLQLQKNELKHFPKSFLDAMPQLDGLYLGNNPLPEELAFRLEDMARQNHLDLVREHFAQREVGELRPNNECKVLLIGNGKAGKTAIVNRIVNNKFDPHWDSTHGISLFRKEFDPYILNYWDFGGQDIYHATHRLFMQKDAVYLLAWSVETNEPFTDHEIKQKDGKIVTRRYQNYGLRYWLEYAKHLGKGSPMNVVQTKIGKDTAIDQSAIGADYEEDFHPEITFHHVESSEEDPFDNGYDELLESIKASVQSIKSEEQTIAGPLFDLREYLRTEQAKGKQLLAYEEYEAKAHELGVKSAREMLETWLHKSGVVYYQPDKFGGQIILDQGWAIKAIYTLFDRSSGVPYEIEQRQGAFTGAFVQDIWQAEYPDQATHELFISFMKSCDLCFEIETGKERPHFRDRLFMAPQLLERVKPNAIDDFWEGRETLHYRYRASFIHEGVIHSFISKTAYLADLREIWRIGIQLKEGDQYACIEAGRHQPTGRKEIHIRLTPNAEQLLAKIRKLLFELQQQQGEEEISREGEEFQPFAQSDADVRGFHRISTLAEGMLMEEKGLEWGGHEQALPDAKGVWKGFEEDQKVEAPEEVIKEIFKEVIREELPRYLTDRGTTIGSQAVESKRILFISANPKSTRENGKLQVDYEHKQITEQLKLGGQRDFFNFLPPLMAMTKSDFLRIEDYCPSILHFAGHGNESGIYIQDGQNHPKLISNLSLNLLCEDLAKFTELVVLNCCLSVHQAEIVAQHIPYVVGTSVRIPDSLAVAFSLGLYNALSEGNDPLKAIRRGVRSVVMEDESAGRHYQAWVKGEKRALV